MVRITFEDGEVVDAILIAFDPVEHGDITYDVKAVHTPGPHSVYKPENVYVASIDSIRSVHPIE